MERLQGKVCVITGGAGSIGMAMARRIAAEGAEIALADRDEAKLRRRCESSEGARWLPIVADVGRNADVEALIRAVVERFGRLDVLVNNAAVWVGDGLATEVSEADWDAIQTGTLKSVFLCCRHAIPIMIRQGGGSIINIASVNGMFGLGLAAYSAAKGGMLALTQTLAAQYGPQGIRVNAISPGTIQTEYWDTLLARDPQALDDWKARTLLHRVGTPEEVAALAAYLASDESRNATGANFVLDAGLTAGMEIHSYRAANQR